MPPPARLSRDQVLDAALALATTDGLDAVTMRAVAAKLGVSAMALYRHVEDKQALLDGLVERILAEMEPPDPALPWRTRLEQMAQALREVARRHPDAFLLLLRRPATTEGALHARGAIYTALSDAGVPDELIPRAERLMSTFMIGFAASEAGGRFAAHDRATLDADLDWLRELVATLLPDGE